MGLFQTTKVILVPVVVATTNPIGAILVLILILCFWQAILTIIATILAITLLVALLSWYKDISEDYSSKSKFIGYALIILFVVGGYITICNKINRHDNSKKEEIALASKKISNSEKYYDESISDNNLDDITKESTKYENKSQTGESYSTSEVKKESTELVTLGNSSSDQELSDRNLIGSNKYNSVLKLTNTAGFYFDGKDYFYKYNDTLYQANDLVFNPDNQTPKSFNIYYFKNQEIIQLNFLFI